MISTFAHVAAIGSALLMLGMLTLPVRAGIPSWVVYPEGEWQTITAEEAGLSSSFTGQVEWRRGMADGHWMAGQNPNGLHGMAITRGGYLIETIGDPELNIQQSASLGKGFTRILLQLTIDEGLIQGKNDLIRNHWTGRGQLNGDHKYIDVGNHRTLTFNHLATMYGGFKVSNGYYYAAGGGDPDFDNYSINVPGTGEHYSSGGMWRLHQAMTAVWNKELKDVLDEKLFSKMGIPASRWSWFTGRELKETVDFYPDWPGYGAFCDPPYEINGKRVQGGGGWVKMSPKDLARLGLLIACRGMWKGERLISDTPFLAGSPGYGNNLLWGDSNTYMSVGMVAMKGWSDVHVPTLASYVTGPVTVTPPSAVYGDADEDNSIGMSDLNLCVDWLLGRQAMPSAGSRAFINADVDGNGTIGMGDLNLLVDYILGRINEFPADS